MGLFDGLLGNTTQSSDEIAEKELQDVLIPNEKVDMAFILVKDLAVFTDRCLILVDKQGITDKKVDYKLTSYESISRFSVETSGHFDLDAEPKIWISSTELSSISFQSGKGKDIVAIQQALAAVVLSRIYKKRQESDQPSCLFNFG